MRIVYLSILACAMLLSSIAHAGTNLLTNGNFSNNSSCQAGVTSLPGWTFQSGNADIINGECNSGMPNSGGSQATYYLDLTGSWGNYCNDVAVISQTVNTVVGQNYVLEFSFGGNSQWNNTPEYPNDSPVKALEVSINNGVEGVYMVNTSGIGPTNAQWKTEKIPFTASQSQTTITFQSLNGSTANPSDFGPLLANVSLVVQ